jgi:hypothetical protein
MKHVVVSLPDELAERIAQRPDRDDFVRRAVSLALERQTPEPRGPETGSRWAQVAARIEQGESLGDYSEIFNRDRAEFRRELRFRHDKP